MPVSLPSDKLVEIQQLTLSLLQRQPVTVHQVISFLVRPPFVPKDMHNLCQLYCVIEIDMLSVYHFIAHLFCSFQLCLSCSVCFRDCLSCSRLQSPGHFLMFLLLQMLHPSMDLFISRVLGFLYPVLEPSQVLCTRFILPCMNSRLLHSCCIEWPSINYGKVVPHIWIIVVPSLIYLISSVEHLFFSRLACHIFNLANKHHITLIPAYIHLHLNVKTDLSGLKICF